MTQTTSTGSTDRAAPPTVAVRLRVNGQDHSLQLDPRVSLLDALREHLHLTGTKKGCDHGQCGACTVHVNGTRINSCLSLAVTHDGDEITTIEGLGSPDDLHPMQAAFVECDGYQCGYCTPGQIMSALATLDEIGRGVPSHVTADLEDVAFSDLEVRERLSGNICRCAAYPNIVQAVRQVHEQAHEGGHRMKAFEYSRVNSAGQALDALQGGGKYLAGGTNLLDLMKLQIETPDQLVDLNRAGMDEISETEDGGLEIGALVRNTDLAAHPRVRRDYAVLSRAILAGASGQIRNRATTAGNLLQRTRCPYFYDTNLPCNKREPGTGCGAIPGYSRPLAVIGTSDHCIAQYPGDMAVALRLLDAEIHTIRRDGSERTIPIADFHLLPGDTPHIENALEDGELIVSVTLPAPLGGEHFYHKARDRQSYAFALVSVAAVVQADGSARVAFGGVAPKPWRVDAAEERWSEGAQAVVDTAFEDARPTAQNAFKLDLARRVVENLMDAAQAEGESA